MKKRLGLFIGAIALLILSWSTVSADINVVALDQFKDSHPQAKFYGTQYYDNDGVFEDIGTANSIYGTVLATGTTPIESAWNHVGQLDGVFAQEIGELVPAVQPGGNVLQGVMYDRQTETYKFYTFRFNQVVGGVPVFRSGIGFLVRNEQNNPLVMSGSNLKEMDGFQAGQVGQAVVTNEMRQSVNEMMNAQTVLRSVLQGRQPLALEVSDERLVVWAGVGNVEIEPQMAVVFIAKRGSVRTLPDYQKHLIVASVATGEVLYSETQIQNVDVQGNVSGRATNGLNALECDPEAVVALPYAQVGVLGGNSTFADENGDFVIPHGGNSQVTVQSFLRGQFFEVFDESAGSSTPQLSLSVTPPGPANFIHNPNNNQEFATANVNAYVEANVVRDFVLFYEPTFPVINSQTGFDIFTNINSSCNAFYDGSSINFYRNGGGCNNTSFSDVVYHEYGHHLISVSGNGQGQMGEGTGDVMGVLIQDEPILGNGFQNCGQGLRNADNNVQYPCIGQIHECGQLISGCVWSLRNELIVTEPSNYRDIGSSLFMGMLIVRGQMQPGNQTIDPMITIYYLELDDDDGDIGNGTPHYTEIAAAFGDHNMDAPALDLFDFNYPDGRPEFISPNGGVAFEVAVTTATADPQQGTGVLHVDRGDGFEQFPMTESSANVYEANFPTSECGIQLRYYISVQSTNALTQTDPSTAPDNVFTAISGESATVIFEDNFQTNQGWTVAGNASTGHWQRGVPVGGGTRGDPASDGDSSGSCYLTENAAGNSDVDDGSTTLTSPIMDASGSASDVAVISYYRWYSNDFGAAPETDIFVVEISNNGGSTWTNLETVGPSGPEVRGGWFHKSFKINDIFPATDQMRLRFTASDLGEGSVVEAGVDGVQVNLVTCDSPGGTVTVSPTSFEVTTGVHVGGGLAELATSDDMDLSAQRSNASIDSVVDLEVKGISPSETPTDLMFTFEASVFSRGAVNQTISLFNYDSGLFEEVDTRAAMRFTDQTVEVTATGDLSRFVEPGTSCVLALIHFESPSIRQRFSANVDQAIWTISF